MDQFVCVRLVRAETLDLTIFDFDPDMLFAVFLMNADKTIYGRYGTRSDFYKAEREISLEGLRAALAKALLWHQQSASLRSALQAKRPVDPKYKTLADYPTARRRGGRRGGRCTHCHDIRTAHQMAFLNAGKPIPDRVLFSWPLPDAAGLNLDPKQAATVKKIWDDSPAERAGFQVGDRIERLNGQPILSIADVQWVLHNASDTDTLTTEIRRADKVLSIDWKLEPGWRRFVDISWRSTTRALRRMFTQSVEYRDLKPQEREEHGLGRGVLALKTQFVPFNFSGPVRDNDVIIGVDGKTKFMSEGDLLAYLAQNKKRGDEVRFRLLRNKKEIDVKFKVN